MEKITFKEAQKKIDEHNKQKGIRQQYQDKEPLYLYIVYREDNWGKSFDEKQRTYVARSDEKYFLPSMMGCSLYGNCLDGRDMGVRLDWYMGEWKMDYCYFDKEPKFNK